jgi:hypothetical protein
MSGSLTNRYTLVAKIEDTPGTFDTAVDDVAYGKHQYIGVPVFNFDFPTIQRGVVRPTFTPVPGLTGKRNASVEFTLELIGHASSGVPTWDKYIRACGMRRETLEKITIGAITGGPFRHGETITQATTGATAKVFMDTYTGTTTLRVYDIRGGENTSGVWTGGLSGATATPSTAGSACGYGYAPVDYDSILVTVTGASSAVAVGEVATGGTSGAIGVVEVIDTYALTVSSVTGTVAVGDIATGGTSGAVAVVDAVLSSTVARVRLRGTTLFAGSETVTYTGSGASATHVSTRISQVSVRVRNALIYTGSETITFSGSATATHSASVALDMPTLSMAGYEDGVRKAGTGFRGTFTLAANVGNPGRFNFQFQGAYEEHGDAAQLTGITYEDQAVPPLMLGANTTLRTEGTASAYATRFSAISLVLGNALAEREDASAASGVREYMITGRAGSGSLDPEADLESSYPMIGNFRDGTVGGLQFTIGSTVGNQFIIQTPGVRFTSTPVGDRNGIRTYAAGFELTGGAMANVSNSPNERNDLLLAYITA